MAIEISLQVDPKNIASTFGDARDQVAKAIPAALNMAASMIQDLSLADIRTAGLKADGFSVTVDQGAGTITTVYAQPYANIFQNGGVIYGKPLLWIPISGTDAVGIPASAYPGGLFSVTRKNGGVPLLFSLRDKAPRYSAINSVNMPKKLRLLEIQRDVMQNFRDVFQRAMSNG